jgi:hypothetical protein
MTSLAEDGGLSKLITRLRLGICDRASRGKSKRKRERKIAEERKT